jgi:hypothetical protein
MRQIGHRSAAFTLDVYTHMMACSPEQRERLKALVEGERRLGPAPPARLGAPAYQEPILRALAASSGSARHKDVMASVEEERASSFGVCDLEIVSGRPRWQADVDVARRRLLERGLVANGSREGIWVLTETGDERVGLPPDAAELKSGRRAVRRDACRSGGGARVADCLEVVTEERTPRDWSQREDKASATNARVRAGIESDQQG